ncbi:hypothetical protein GDO78_013655 [Eleutherodactylus coqui]|uniref:Uncharacterized protein n=1 Tax=Eleutherodactylus coqui TaxID=57060 RepID=A0A8J6B3T9_ELECQ|nr:hypothetical protein GDO78_013655 [Eleutherodactylus coqui]
MQEASRREKRRLLDAQRGKCRVRLGSHLDEWCALKDHLGFSLHSQLAKFLLDSYRTSSGVGTPEPKPVALLSVSVPSLHRLAFLCQQHGRTCNSFLTILTKPCSLEAPEAARLLWGCKEDHRFYWDPHDSSAGPGGNSAEEDVPGLPFMRQEDVPEMPQEGGPVMTAEDKVDLPRVEPEPHGTALQEGLYEEPSRSDTSPNASPEQCDDAEDSQTTAANGWPLNTNVPEKQQEEGTDEALCRGQEIIVPSSEVGGTEDARPQMVEISEDTQESISMDLAKKPKSPSFGEECKKPEKPLSECHQQALMSEPKAALSFTCRRSPRSSKGCRMKADVTVQAPVSRVQLRSVARTCSGMKGQDVDVLVGSAPNTDTSQTTSLVQESLAGNSPRRKPPSEDLEGLATVEEKEPPSAEPQSDRVQMPRAPEEDVPNAEMELHDNTRQEPQSAQCRGQKAGR